MPGQPMEHHPPFASEYPPGFVPQGVDMPPGMPVPQTGPPQQGMGMPQPVIPPVVPYEDGRQYEGRTPRPGFSPVIPQMYPHQGPPVIPDFGRYQEQQPGPTQYIYQQDPSSGGSADPYIPPRRGRTRSGSYTETGSTGSSPPIVVIPPPQGPQGVMMAPITRITHPSHSPSYTGSSSDTQQPWDGPHGPHMVLQDPSRPQSRPHSRQDSRHGSRYDSRPGSPHHHTILVPSAPQQQQPAVAMADPRHATDAPSRAGSHHAPAPITINIPPQPVAQPQQPVMMMPPSEGGHIIRIPGSSRSPSPSSRGQSSTPPRRSSSSRRSRLPHVIVQDQPTPHGTPAPPGVTIVQAPSRRPSSPHGSPQTSHIVVLPGRSHTRASSSYRDEGRHSPSVLRRPSHRTHTHHSPSPSRRDSPRTPIIVTDHPAPPPPQPPVFVTDTRRPRSPEYEHGTRRPRSPEYEHGTRRPRSPEHEHVTGRPRSPEYEHAIRRPRSPEYEHGTRRRRSPSYERDDRRRGSPSYERDRDDHRRRPRSYSRSRSRSPRRHGWFSSSRRHRHGRDSDSRSRSRSPRRRHGFGFGRSGRHGTRRRSRSYSPDSREYERAHRRRLTRGYSHSPRSGYARSPDRRRSYSESPPPRRRSPPFEEVRQHPPPRREPSFPPVPRSPDSRAAHGQIGRHSAPTIVQIGGHEGTQHTEDSQPHIVRIPSRQGKCNLENPLLIADPSIVYRYSSTSPY